jgi:hypothetical protein
MLKLIPLYSVLIRYRKIVNNKGAGTRYLLGSLENYYGITKAKIWLNYG